MKMTLTSPCPRRLRVLAVALGLFLAAQPLSHAQGLLASDDASNYLSGWTNNSNGGHGFTPWTLSAPTSGNPGGFFIGSSAEGGARTTNIDTGGAAFGMWTQNSGTGNTTQLRATRGFAQDIWDVGHTLTFDYSFRFDGGTKGLQLRQGTTNIFSLTISGAGYAWTGSGMANGSAPATAWDGQREFGEVLSFTVTQLAGNQVQWAFSGLYASSPNASGVVNGTLQTFRFWSSVGEGGGGNDIFVNNFQVIPEPSTYAAIFGALALLGAFAYRRRQAGK
jgi:hypothetical protein